MNTWSNLKQRQRQRHLRVVETQPIPLHVPALAEPARALKSIAPSSVPRYIIGSILIGSAVVLAVTSMRANAWFGYALSVDDTAGQIFASLSVTAELIAFVMPTANRLYCQMGEPWTAARGWFLAVVASAVVAFAASGFVLTNVGDNSVMRSLKAPAVQIARVALDDAKLARDRECTKVGPICRQREDAVVARQQDLTEAMMKADPLVIDPRLAWLLVAMCLLAGLVLSHGWGLVFLRPSSFLSQRPQSKKYFSQC